MDMTQKDAHENRILAPASLRRRLVSDNSSNGSGKSAVPKGRPVRKRGSAGKLILQDSTSPSFICPLADGNG
jgi:hypothetical protein